MSVRKRLRGSPQSATWRKATQGFTLVELLVVITIIGMLMAIAFPAFSGVLGLVRQNQCSQKLKSISTALSTYRASNSSRYPTASTRPWKVAPGTIVAAKKTTKANAPAAKDAVESGFSWIVQILTNFDQPLYSQIATASGNFSKGAFDPEIRNAEGRHCSTQALTPLQCPGFDGSTSDPSFTSKAPEYQNQRSNGGEYAVALTNYVAVAGTHMAYSGAKVPVAKSGAKVVGGQDGSNAVIGLRSGKGVDQIRDGDSKTIIIAETRERNYASWYDGTTAWVVAHHPETPEPTFDAQGQLSCEGACQHSIQKGPVPTDPNRANQHYMSKWEGSSPWSWGPSSEHGSLAVNHLFADSHVSAISPGISATTYMWLVTRNGNEVVNEE